MWRQLDKRPFWSSKRVKILLIAAYFSVVAGYFLIGLLPVRAEDSLASAGRLVIPAIGINGEVVETRVEEDEFIIPRERIAVHKRGNKTLMMAHAATGFSTLKEIRVGDEIEYLDGNFVVVGMEYRKVEEISMREILKSEEKEEMVLMTCAGEEREGKYTERLIVWAEKIGEK